MDEKQRKGTPQRDPVYFVTRAQVVVCLILGLTVFAVTKLSPAAGDALRRDFARLAAMELDVGAVRDAASYFKNAVTVTTASDAAFDASDGTPEPTAETAPSEDASENIDSPSGLTEGVAPSDDATDEKSSDADAQPTVQTPDVRQTKKTAAAAPKTQTVAVMSEVVQPVDNGRYTSYFGDRVNPITHQRAFHTGLDIAVPEGTAIKAAYAGMVRKTGEDERSGKYLILSHGDFETFYCHCSRIIASEGDVVAAGDVIARVGETGWATGPHLHFEIRKDGERLDPLPVLTGDDG